MVKDDAYYASRRQFLQTLAATGAIAAADLAWWQDPFLGPRRARAAASTVRFQFSVPEPLRISLVESLVERFNKSQSDVEVKVEFVPQAQARQKLITAVSAGSPPDCCQIWDNWVGEFDGMNALEDLTARIKDWKHYKDTVPVAWQTVTVKGKLLSFPWVVTNDAIFVRTDRAKEYGLKIPGPDWTWDDFLTLAKGYTKPDKNQYGFGMRGAGTWAVLYATEFLYSNGAQVLKDGKVVINSPESVRAFEWYIDLIRKHKITPPSVATDGYRQIVEGFGRGVTSMYLHNSGSVEEQKKFVGEPNFATLPLPLGPAKKRASFYFSETLTMFKAAKNKEGAWKFMTWLMDDEPNYDYAKTLGLLPTRQALADRPHYKHPGYQGFVKSFPFSIVSPYLAYAGWGGKLDSEGVPLVQQAMLGKISPKECLDKLAEVLTRNMA
ncbi:MAG: sugar ABC transporter substrate-binding protein [candidate division NC10 bacterium]|nr:sugar ABC transporter substrate-binding protein [candidate division NC10 bacterium]MBI2113677.1 sugar ABC transporter substrate-binding protein [candidate division NC10 bacterium]MBI2163335.1 sugar ABC transporter substrate-binding protein [candidate division NC10 bacterium]MBI2455523.1 sugar ABC transporter substrate-binding protein [candidate division NC10 bacterium]MBI2562003.1 sugar ABC transporter substrate-binding protein [candidate division NC10 bacterium]